MKIRFTAKPSARSGGEEFEVGESYDLSEDSARRWLRRGIAVEVQAVSPPNAAKPKPSRREVAKKVNDDG